MTKWSDSYSWKMDLLKSAISYTVVTIATILLFTFFLDRKQHKWEAKYGIKLETFKDFEKTSLIYSNMTFDIFYAIYNPNLTNSSTDSLDAIKKWQNEGYDNLDVAEKSLRHWFHTEDKSNKELQALLDNLDAQKTKFKNLFYSVPKIQGSVGWETFKEKNLAPIRNDFSEIRNKILNTCFDLLD